MKIGNPLPHKHARIEIIPLIDIMFFLLAAFMLASLSMIRMQTHRVDLPEAKMAKPDFKPDIVNISIDKSGEVFIDKKQVDLGTMRLALSNAFRVNTNVPVYISGDRDAAHGNVVRVLDQVRAVGIQRVSFAISQPSAKPVAK
jgi:biopolymer transport protein ExbD